MEQVGEKHQDQQINMKTLLILFSFVIPLLANAQSDSVTYYADSLVYRIDTTIIAGNDTITSDSNYVRHNYSYINGDSIYEDQFVILDSIGKVLTPIKALMDNGRSSNGTVYRKKLTVVEMGYTPKQLADSLWLPVFKSIYGAINITEL